MKLLIPTKCIKHRAQTNFITKIVDTKKEKKKLSTGLTPSSPSDRNTEALTSQSSLPSCDLCRCKCLGWIYSRCSWQSPRFYWLSVEKLARTLWHTGSRKQPQIYKSIKHPSHQLTSEVWMFSVSERIRCSSDPLDFSGLCQLDGFQGFSYRTGEMHLTTSAGSHAPLYHLKKHTVRFKIKHWVPV